MLRLVADENFDGTIVDGLLLRRSDLDLVRVQDIGLTGADDPTVLAWAASARRVVLTHDVQTMIGHAYARVKRGEAMPGVWEVNPAISIGQAIDDLLILVECSHEGEWEGRVEYLPL